ncbi:hypothetical protein CRG98_024637 [Punica granatum]|uniref:Uncharacterized protein n=1 Tax=Punica granatum TaxID=22663 RepID=A0A2I0JFC4_PUNGR|nr:hypothetical protein CRG98_024637 [Punica granatum]
MHRVRRGYVHGRGGGMLARRGRTHSVVLVDALGSAKGRVLGHAMLGAGPGELFLRSRLVGEFLMRIVGMTMRPMHTSLEVGLMKRELKHKILEACMFRVGQSNERRPDKSNKLWRAC